MNKLFSSYQTHLPKWRYRGVLVAILLAVVLGLGVLSFAPAAHAASRVQTSSTTHSAAAIINRCQPGYACFYPGTGWNGGHPTQEWYNYGTYRISGWYGRHRIFNNQTGGALFWLCTDDFGKTCPMHFRADYSTVVNLTPINSVKLTP